MSAEGFPTVRMSAVLSAVASLLVTVVCGRYSLVGFGSGLLGVVLVATGVGFGRRRVLSAGWSAIVVTVVAAGTGQAPLPVVLGGAVTTAVGWNSGRTAIDLAEQLTASADTVRLELVSFASTVAVGTLIAVPVWGITQVDLGAVPSLAPLFLLAATLAIGLVLYHRTDLEG